jgi:hypothetical protein
MSGPLLDPNQQPFQFVTDPRPGSPVSDGRGASATAKVFGRGSGQGLRKKARPPGSQISTPSKGQHP